MEGVRAELDLQAMLSEYQNVLNSSKGVLYQYLVPLIPYKEGCGYLNCLNKKHRMEISRFRLRNVFHRLETGSWHGIPRDMRLCPKCGVIDDDAHYLLHCSIFADIRPRRLDYNPNDSDMDIIKHLLCSTNPRNLHNLAIFLLEARTRRRELYSNTERTVAPLDAMFNSLG